MSCFKILFFIVENNCVTKIQIYKKRKNDRQTETGRKEERNEKEGRDGGRKDSVVKRPSETVVSLLYL